MHSTIFPRRLDSTPSRRLLADVVRPIHPVTKQERIALRAARKERAAQVLQQAKGVEGEASGAAAGTSSSGRTWMSSKYMWYASVGVPSALLIWGISDKNSPPAKFSKMIGLTGLIETYGSQIAKPSHDKLLPDWSQVSLGQMRCPSICDFFHGSLLLTVYLYL